MQLAGSQPVGGRGVGDVGHEQLSSVVEARESNMPSVAAAVATLLHTLERNHCSLASMMCDSSPCGLAHLHGCGSFPAQ